ncbi:hypothetical protein, partial [Wolbachia endosymbiont of Pentidionis agamae]|uniref:hypothetical protein n=1 Tax=Wolbachia endosymbiont of Pentidionis agamae TaxID=3110435 RepID=UPI002FCF9CFB
VSLLKIIDNNIKQYRSGFQKAELEARGIINCALNDVEVMKSSINAVLNDELKKISNLLELEVLKMKSEYYDELKIISINMASAYYSKLTRFKVEKKLVSNLVSKEFKKVCLHH